MGLTNRRLRVGVGGGEKDCCPDCSNMAWCEGGSPGAFGLSGARAMARAYSTAPRNRKDSLTNVKYGYEECAQVRPSSARPVQLLKHRDPG